MARTVEQIDKDLREAAAARRKCRDDLRKPNITVGERDTLVVREGLMDERIERLLDERSQAKMLDQLATL